MGRHSLAQSFLHGLRQSRRLKLAGHNGSHETTLCQQASALRLVRHRLAWNDDRGDAGLEQIGARVVAGLADRKIGTRQLVEKAHAVWLHAYVPFRRLKILPRRGVIENESPLGLRQPVATVS